jgi:3-oxoacyl-[acyl-carrier protein] reductase
MTTSRTVLVTGGSRGIGAAVVQTLRTAGWNVLAPARSELDLSEPLSFGDFLGGRVDRIDGLVLSAGINSPARIDKLTLADWQAIYDVNTLSNVALVAALCPAMASVGFGRVVGISSAYANRARAGRAAYSASKAALEALIRTVAVEFGPSGVVANCVAPGFVDTELTRANNTPEMVNVLLQRVPVGRLASPSEIGRAVAFLLSPENEYITGQTLAVDGGFGCT